VWGWGSLDTGTSTDGQGHFYTQAVSYAYPAGMSYAGYLRCGVFAHRFVRAERRGDVIARIAAQGGPRNEADRSMLARGADVMAMIQVPLVHDHRGVLGGLPSFADGGGYGYTLSDDPLSAGGFGLNDSTIRVRPGPVRSTLDRAVLGLTAPSSTPSPKATARASCATRVFRSASRSNSTGRRPPAT
jgi:hypothetical protein